MIEKTNLSEETKTTESTDVAQSMETEAKIKNRRKSSPRKKFPSNSIEEAKKVSELIKSNNGGNPWATDQLAKALNTSIASHEFFYIVAASRDYGFTIGSNKTTNIELTDLGRNLVYATSSDVIAQSIKKAFNNVELFKSVFEFYNGAEPENEEFFKNALLTRFEIAEELHNDFLKIYRQNVDYINGSGASHINKPGIVAPTSSQSVDVVVPKHESSITDEQSASKNLFVIMPFTERTEKYDIGFFTEVYNNLIVPAAHKSNMRAYTAKKEGSDGIHSTIGKEIRKADIILADLTEHNPNVLFELGLAIMMKKHIVLIRAKGTSAIFDIDHVIRVWDYDPRLWPSLIEKDIPELAKHISAIINPSDKSYYDLFLGN